MRSTILFSVFTIGMAAFAGATAADFAKIKFPHDNPTEVNLINNVGTVAGQHGDGFAGRAFVRTTGGKFIDFAVEGAVVTIPRGLTDEGAVGGRYDLPDDTIHGFLRDASGILTPFDGPGLGAAEINGMNASNDIVGTYFRDQQQNLGGFIRHPDGSFTLFSIKDAYPGAFHIAGINTKGEIAGYYSDPNFISHGFLRKANGRIATFEAGQSTTAAVLNDGGWIAGFHDQMHGYVRHADGVLEPFDPPGALIAITGMNDGGDITGCYAAGFRNHGFIRKASGKMVTFDLPWGDSEDMCPEGINNSGQVAGHIRLGTFGEKEFGFIRTP